MAGDNVVNLGKHGLISDILVTDFLVGMALCRCGPSNPTQMAKEMSGWLECDVKAAALGQSLARGIERGWVRREAGIYAITQAGMDAVKGVYAAVIRLLDRGQRFLDVGVFMSIMKDFERSLEHEDR